MTKEFNWKEILFPIFSDLVSINKESETSKIVDNNWSLALDEVEYKKISDKKQAQNSSKLDENENMGIIIIES